MKKHRTLMLIAAMTVLAAAFAATIAAPSAFATEYCTAGGGGILNAGQHLITVVWSVDGHCVTSWTGNDDLRNTSGQTNMAGYPQNISGSGPVTWADNGLYCAPGKVTHTFMYVNNQGHGSSFTGGNYTCT